MIPKRAFFLWVGYGELPWLRKLSIGSFRKQNPDWNVQLIRVEPIASLLPAQNTDLCPVRGVGSQRRSVLRHRRSVRQTRA